MFCFIDNKCILSGGWVWIWGQWLCLTHLFEEVLKGIFQMSYIVVC